MGNLHTETVARYTINGHYYYVTMCWEGKEPSDDPNVFYDLYDHDGVCINLGEPWHHDDQGVPTHDDVSALITERNVMWMIRHKEVPSGAHLDDFDDTGTAVLHWSNEDGWCSKDCADVWPTRMKSIVGLPLNGQWVSVEVIPTKKGE